MTFSIFPYIYRYKQSIMGRKSKTEEEKKGKISVSISSENYGAMVAKGINKSQLINWLLEQHFNTIKK
jgi:hypothetical protein